MGNIELMNQINVLIDELNKVRFIDSQEALRIGGNVYSLSQQAGYEFGKALALLRICEAYLNIGKYEEALNNIYDAIAYFSMEGIGDLEAGAYVLLGNIFTDLADYEKSIEFYQIAEKAADRLDENKVYNKQVNKDSIMTIVLNNEGEVYRLLKDFKEAYNCYVESEKIDRAYDYLPSRGISLLNLSEIEYLRGNYEDAINYANKSIDCMNKYNVMIGQTETFRVLAQTYWKKGDYEKAEEYFKKSINSGSSGLTPYYHIENLIFYSEYLQSRKCTAKALSILEEACNLSVENELLEKEVEASAMLASAYKNIGNDKEALKYYEIHYSGEQKLNDAQASRRAASLKARKRLQVIEKEREEMLGRNERLARKSKELQGVIDNISIISELGQKITANLDLNEITLILSKSIKSFMNFAIFGIGLYSPEEQSICDLRFIRDGQVVYVHNYNLSVPERLELQCIKNRQFIVINDMKAEAAQYFDTSEEYIDFSDKGTLNSAICCPLATDNNVIGFMIIKDKKINAFTDYHVEMIKALSAYTAIAANNAMKSMYLALEVENRRNAQLELEKANAQLLYLSENDGLTGIHNRRKFDSYMNKLWDKKGENFARISLILFDIDCFKEFNDNYGHVEGDKCIIKIAHTLASLTKDVYFSARYGGDEFVVVMPNAPLQEAISWGEAFIAEIEKLNLRHDYSKVSDIVTVTLGAVCLVSGGDLTINEFVRKADNVLYTAKQKGRNQIIGIEL